MSTKESKGIPVIVCTDKDHRGVFFGYVDDVPEKIEPTGTYLLRDARMVVYWSSDVMGVLGLAATGPSPSCKISKSVPEFILSHVTCFMKLTEEAIYNWENEVWISQ